jgi:hypothetical protein
VNPIIKYGILAAVAVVAWGLSRNIDGPIVHFLVTALAVWVAYGFVKGM